MATIVPTVETIGDEALTNSIIDRSITELQDNILTSIPPYSLTKCADLKKVVLTKVKHILGGTFTMCESLETIDLWETEVIGTLNSAVDVFVTDGTLKSLILRANVVCSCVGMYSTRHANAPAKIYVPAALLDQYKSTSPWSNRADTIYAIEDYPEVCDPYSWEAVSKAIEKGTYKDVYKIGDTVPLDLGSEGIINMQIAAFDADTLADGSGKAAITWIAKELLRGSYMNSGSNNEGGWQSSEMRSYCEETVLGAIPEDVAEIICPVLKKSNAGRDSLTVETSDRIWIPSRSEVSQLSSTDALRDQGSLYPLFSDDASRIKFYMLNGAAYKQPWWLRTASAVNSTHFWYVNDSGAIRSGYSSYHRYFAFGFCTGRTPA